MTSSAHVPRLFRRSARLTALLVAAVLLAAPAVISSAPPSPSGVAAPAEATESVIGLREPATGPGVRAVQERLISLGYVVHDPLGTFGRGTTNTLRRFQEQNGLNPTGVVTEMTAFWLGWPDGIPTTADEDDTSAADDETAVEDDSPGAPPTGEDGSVIGLREPATGPGVRAVQERLISLGYVVHDPLGTFGRGTTNTLRRFQEQNGLNPTGVVTEMTAFWLGWPDGIPTAHPRDTAATVESRPEPGAGGDGGSTAAEAAAPASTDASDATTAAPATAALATTAAPTTTPAPTTTTAPAAQSVTLAVNPVAGACWYTDTWHNSRSGGRIHLGVDIGAREGTPLRAVADGRITYHYTDRPGSRSGNALKLTTSDGTYFFYAHLAGFGDGIARGVPVTAGEIIGYVGETGNALLPHLHFEVHPGGGAAINPYPMVRAAGPCG